MSTRCNIAIKLKEKDLNKELTCDGIHFQNTKADYPFMEVYCHHDGYPENAKDFFFNRARLTDYESVLNYVLQGDRTSFETSYMESGEQWPDNRPYMFASIEGDIPEQYYYIFMDGKWYYKERSSDNDQPMDWIELVPDAPAAPLPGDPDFEYIAREIKALVERLTDGKYTTTNLTKEILTRK